MIASFVDRPKVPVLADVLPGGALRDAALVAGAAAFTGLAAQVSVPLPFTPVPISLATFAVLLSGAALGPHRAAGAMLVYLVAGAAGVPWFSDQRSGFGFVTFGYIVGFAVAAPMVGALARRGADRSIRNTAAMMILGNLVIYAFGVPYLAVAAGMSLLEAVVLGAVPFVLGDAVKIAAAALLLPGAWRLLAEDR